MEALGYFLIAAGCFTIWAAPWVIGFLAVRYIIRDAIDRAKT